MRIHISGLPHTDITPDWSTCAFSQKIRHLCTMLANEGHLVTLYASERTEISQTHAVETVAVVTEADRRRWFGSETWRERVFDRWDSEDQCWSEMNANIVKAMAERIEPDDLIACPIGSVQRAVVDAFPGHLAFESGIGYEGSWLPFRVFESYAWMHHTYGRQGINDGRYFDAVIPNAFDPSEFTYSDDHDNYVLFMGRHISRKGLAVVEEVAKHHRVLTAGQGDERVAGAEYVGVVNGWQRADLLANARCLLAPTQYIEPFGGVAVEAMLSGTPVIASPWGAFSETISPGVTGYLPHTLAETLTAVDACGQLDPWRIRMHADRYTLDATAPQYDAYLARLDTLRGDGWYQG